MCPCLFSSAFLCTRTHTHCMFRMHVHVSHPGVPKIPGFFIAHIILVDPCLELCDSWLCVEFLFWLVLSDWAWSLLLSTALYFSREWPWQGRQSHGTKGSILWWFLCLSYLSPNGLDSIQVYGNKDISFGVKGACMRVCMCVRTHPHTYTSRLSQCLHFKYVKFIVFQFYKCQ